MAPAGESSSTWPSEYSSKAAPEGHFDHICVKFPTCKAELLTELVSTAIGDTSVYGVPNERKTGPGRSRWTNERPSTNLKLPTSPHAIRGSGTPTASGVGGRRRPFCPTRECELTAHRETKRMWTSVLPDGDGAMAVTTDSSCSIDSTESDRSRRSIARRHPPSTIAGSPTLAGPDGPVAGPAVTTPNTTCSAAATAVVRFTLAATTIETAILRS